MKKNELEAIFKNNAIAFEFLAEKLLGNKEISQELLLKYMLEPVDNYYETTKELYDCSGLYSKDDYKKARTEWLKGKEDTKTYCETAFKLFESNKDEILEYYKNNCQGEEGLF